MNTQPQTAVEFNLAAQPTIAADVTAAAAQIAAVTTGTPQPVCAPVVPIGHTAKALDAWVAQFPSSTQQLVAAAVVSNTQPSPLPAASTPSPIITLAWCNAWLQFTYAHELAGLTKLGAYVLARAVCAPGQKVSPSTSVLLTVKDGWFGGEAGLDGALTFTFGDTDCPKVPLGGLTMAHFQDMAYRFWQALPTIKDVYQARDSYIAARGGNSAEALPDVEDRAGSVQYQWFTGDKLPKMDETEHQYSQPKLLALVNAYDQKADDGV